MLSFLRYRFRVALPGLLLPAVLAASAASAQQIAEPVSSRRLDVAYWTVLGTATAGVAFDAYTTLSSIGPGKRCNAEVESPALYGRVPTPARTVAVMGAQLASAIFLSRQLRHHTRSRTARRAALLLASANAVHFAGAIHNQRICN
jgi:hypothetical protein